MVALLPGSYKWCRISFIHPRTNAQQVALRNLPATYPISNVGDLAEGFIKFVRTSSRRIAKFLGFVRSFHPKNQRFANYVLITWLVVKVLDPPWTDEELLWEIKGWLWLIRILSGPRNLGGPKDHMSYSLHSQHLD